MATLQPAVPQKKHGCFFYGCIISLVLLLLLAVGIGFVGWYAVHTIRAAVVQYTDTSPMTIDKVELPADQLKMLNDRVAAFESAAEAHSNTPPLVLTGPELDALIASSPKLAPYKDKFFITLEGNTIKGEISLPMNDMGAGGFVKMMHANGRYLNGSGTFSAGITNGQLAVFVQSLEVKGSTVPPQMLVGMQQQNLADGYNRQAHPNPFENYQSIQIKDGTVIVTPKGN